MKTLLKFMVVTLIAGLMFYGFDALADTNTNVFTRAFSVLGNVFKNVRVIVYIVGAFGLIGIAVMAILGKLQFKWLAYLAIGLAIVAAADLVVKFATGGGKSGDKQWEYNANDADVDKYIGDKSGS